MQQSSSDYSRYASNDHFRDVDESKSGNRNKRKSQQHHPQHQQSRYPSQSSYQHYTPTQTPNPHGNNPIHHLSTLQSHLGITRFRVESSLSNFMLGNQVGEGTYGKVYKATDTITGRNVALKKIYLKDSGERGKNKDGYPLTMLREIDILKSLRHPNIIEFMAAASFSVRTAFRCFVFGRHTYEESYLM